MNMLTDHRNAKIAFVITALLMILYVTSKSGEIPQSSNLSKEKNQPESQSEFSAISSQAKTIAKSHKLVFLLYLNEAFLAMTKNFICNLKKIGSADVLNQTIFVTTQKSTMTELLNFDASLHVLSQEYSGDQGDVSYGTSAYYKLTLERIRLQRDLILAGINVFIIESDATWFSGGEVLKRLGSGFEKFDVVSAGFVSKNHDFALNQSKKNSFE